MATTEIQKLSLLARFFQKEYFSYGSRLSHAKLDLFILIAFLLHISVVTFDLIAPLNIKKPPPPIKVKYVDTQISELLKQKKPSVDSLKKSQNKKTKPPKLIAIAKPKRLIKKQPQKQKKHRKKPAASKTHRTPNIVKQSKVPVAKRKKEANPKKSPPSPSVFFSQKKTLAMLDGLHPEKYALQDPPIEEGEGLDSDEPIPLDTKEKKYVSYFGRIKQQIQRAWIYPIQGTKKRLSGEVTLRFEISKDGNLLDLRLINSSGADVLDINAIKAVKEAAPYYPFPQTISKKKLSILATFVYSAN